MQSKNKKAPTKAERDHIERIKQMDCVVCGLPGPSECHELRQGEWFTSLPLCPDCHRGSHNGIHGQKRMWDVMRLDELSALNKTIQQICEQLR